MIIHITFFFILSFVTSIFSIVNVAYYSPVMPINIFGTSIFLLGICLYSYYNGLKKDNIIVIYSMEILLILVSYISGNYISNKRKS